MRKSPSRQVYSVFAISLSSRQWAKADEHERREGLLKGLYKDLKKRGMLRSYLQTNMLSYVVMLY